MRTERDGYRDRAGGGVQRAVVAVRADPVTFVVIVALVLTALVILVPSVRFAYRSETLHVSLEATGGLITMSAGYLVFGRHKISGARRDLFLAAALLVLGLNGFLLAFPWGGIGGRGNLFIWRGVISRVIGGGLFAWAAFMPRSGAAPSAGRGRSPGRSGGVVLALLATSVAVSLVFGSLVDIDPGVPPDLSPEASGRPLFVGHPLLLGVQLVVMALYALTAFALRRAAIEEDDTLLRWLAMGVSMLAVSRIHYFLFPSIYSEWAYTGDLFRIAGQTMFLLGSALEIRRYWTSVAEAAVIDERRSIAHDLHDGLAQELALIAGNARRLRSQEQGSERTARTVEMIALASERALREARSAIKALSVSAPQSLDVVVRSAAEEAAADCDCRLSVDIDRAITVPLRVQEGVRWIVAEAVTNAAKHSGARHITVSSTGDEPDWVIRIEDDGTGFDPAAPRAAGFGLTMMTERAQALGLRLTVGSSVGTGTSVLLEPDGSRRRAQGEGGETR